MSKKAYALMSVVLVMVAAAAYPIGGAIAAIMKTKIVNTVKVQESGAKVFKIFDSEMPAESRFTPSKNLKGFKTVRVVVYQTVDGGSGGAPVETNYSCGGPPAGRLGVDVYFGNGLEAGVTAGNNTLQINEPPNLSSRADIYAGEVPLMRPTIGLDLCNHTNDVERVAVYLYAFRN